jgi:phage terminase large subunit-like protein
MSVSILQAFADVIRRTLGGRGAGPTSAGARYIER